MFELAEPAKVTAPYPEVPLVVTKKNSFWETIEHDDFTLTNRGKVPGGWMMYMTSMEGETHLPMVPVFIADPTHSWVLQK